MPACKECGITQATVEMRRSPKKGPSGETLYLCKETLPCKARAREKKRTERRLRRLGYQD